jgi:hypothetical protein
LETLLLRGELERQTTTSRLGFNLVYDQAALKQQINSIPTRCGSFATKLPETGIFNERRKLNRTSGNYG